MSYLTRFNAAGNSYTFPLYNQAFNDNFRDLQSQFTRLPGRSGAFDGYGSEHAVSGLGIVQVSFSIYSATRAGMEALRDALAAMAHWDRGLLYQQPSVLTDGERFCTARFVGAQMPKSMGGLIDIEQKVSMAFEVPLPWWILPTVGALWGGSTWGTDSWGDSSGQGGSASGDDETCSGLTTEFTRTNTGAIETVPQIVIDVPSGKVVTTIKVQRIESGAVVDEVNYPLALAADDQLIIDPNKFSVKKNTVDAYASTFTTVRGRWFIMKPGVNSIKVLLGDAGDECIVTLNYETRYLQ